MHLVYRNVNEAFKTVVRAIYDGTFPVSVEGSRNGDVLRLEEPLLLTYTRPVERVLFNSARDANPFFHLMEAMWMLAGRNDLEPVAYYARQMREYSDDGKTLNGAYGHRWRHAHGVDWRKDRPILQVDQLNVIVDHLTRQPFSRRAVLRMWDVQNDLLKIDKSGNYPCCEGVVRVETVPGDATTLTGGQCPIHGATWFAGPSRDVCCNLDVMFAIREQNISPTTPNRGDGVPLRFLDATVTNRSNDLVWGLFGANSVHFSVLQEYMAAQLGVQVGKLNIFTNNAHAYVWNWKPEEWLAYYGSDAEVEYVPACCMVPLVEDAARFEAEIPQFVEDHTGQTTAPVRVWGESFLRYVAAPMCHAFHCHKTRDYKGAMAWMAEVEADDWRCAGTVWLEWRRTHYER
jgi:thymidylate synthase